MSCTFSNFFAGWCYISFSPLWRPYCFSSLGSMESIRLPLISFMRSGRYQCRYQAPIGLVGYWTVVSVLCAGLLFLLIWIYRSITNVRRIALRFQAVLLLITCLSNVNTTWPELKFAFKNLSTEFAILAALSAGSLLLVFPVSVAIALWGVSRSPGTVKSAGNIGPAARSECLDLSKQAPRSSANAAAEDTDSRRLRALSCWNNLIDSIHNALVIAWRTGEQVALLAMACKGDVMPECVAVSSGWAHQTLLSMLVALVAFKIATFLQATAKRLGVT